MTFKELKVKGHSFQYKRKHPVGEKDRKKWKRKNSNTTGKNEAMVYDVGMQILLGENGKFSSFLHLKPNPLQYQETRNFNCHKKYNGS